VEIILERLKNACLANFKEKAVYNCRFCLNLSAGRKKWEQQ
jgi:hypothetical protein